MIDSPNECWLNYEKLKRQNHAKYFLIIVIGLVSNAFKVQVSENIVW